MTKIEINKYYKHSRPEILSFIPRNIKSLLV